MAQATKAYKRTISGSIGAGMGAVFGSGRTYYILEHKTSSKYHSAGESQEIIVDQIELGRDAKCQIRYDDSFGTVSRRHAAIVREGDRWKLVHLSETNSTLLNGQRIDRETYLQSGDEIQLSSGGPKLGFIVPTGRKAKVGSIGLTRRLSLFRQQALTPYKKAIWTLSILLVLAIGGGIVWGTKMGDDIAAIQAKLDEQRLSLADAIIKHADNQDTVRILMEKFNEVNQKYVELSMRRGGGGYVAPRFEPNIVPSNTNDSSTISPPSTPQLHASSDVSSCNPHVYAVYVDEMYCELPWGDVPLKLGGNKFIGTGFMLSDGRFVTARHVVEPWYYYQYLGNANTQEAYKLFNYASFNMGRVYAKYTIVSPTGKRYSFENEQVICNRSNDRISREDEVPASLQGRDDIKPPVIYRTATQDRYDCAYFQTSATSGLKFDNTLSTTLTQGTQLDILGYPNGMGTEDINNLTPIYSSCITSGSGINSNGIIMTSNIDIMGGNSGGPVLAKKDGGYVVVGLVSGTIQRKGIIVPIYEVRR